MAESQAVLDIYNIALVRVGDPPVASQSASQPCEVLYPDVRDFLLSIYPWPFAVVRQALTKLADAPPTGVGFGADRFLFQFALPAAPFLLRVLDIDAQRFRYRMETYAPSNTPQTLTKVLLTDAPSVICRYIARVSESVWSPLFKSVVALRLALVIAERKAGKSALFSRLAADYAEALAMAKNVEGHQDSPTIVKFNHTYIDVRHSGADSVYPYLQDFEEFL